MGEGCLGELEEGQHQGWSRQSQQQGHHRTAESRQSQWLGHPPNGRVSKRHRTGRTLHLGGRGHTQEGASGEIRPPKYQTLPSPASYPTQLDSCPSPELAKDSHFLLEIERWAGLLKSKEAAQRKGKPTPFPTSSEETLALSFSIPFCAEQRIPLGGHQPDQARENAQLRNVEVFYNQVIPP